MRITFTSLSIVLGVLGASAASAATPPSRAELVVEARRGLDINQRSVPYTDLALASPSGQRTLYRRIGFAIGSLCDGMHVTDPVGALQCNNVAWTSARAQLQRVMPAR